MDITARMLCYLLARKPELLVHVPRASDPVIKGVRIWSSQAPADNMAYIAHAHDPIGYIVGHGAVAIEIGPKTKLEDAAATVSDMLFATADWDGHLKDLVYTGCTGTELLDEGVKIISELLNIVTNDLRILGSVTGRLSQRYGVEHCELTGRATFTDDTVDELMTMDDYSRAANIRGVFFYPYERDANVATRYICGNVFHKSVSSARLVAERPDDLDGKEIDGLVLMIRHFLEYVQMAYSKQWDLEGTAENDDMFRRLLQSGFEDETRISRDGLVRAAERRGWDVSADYLVICATFFEGALWENLGTLMCDRLEEAEPGSCAVSEGDRFIWICNLSNRQKEGSKDVQNAETSGDLRSDSKILHAGKTATRKSKSLLKEQADYPQKTTSFLRQGDKHSQNYSMVPRKDDDIVRKLVIMAREFTFRVGISRVIKSILDIPEGIRQAWRALEIGNRDAPHIWYHRFDDCARAYLYDQMTSELPPQLLVHPCIDQLKEFDAKHGTDYLPTLKSYFDNGFNGSQASKQMNVHHTTFSRRLSRIKELTGSDLWNPQTRLDLMLSFWMLNACEKPAKTRYALS